MRVNTKCLRGEAELHELIPLDIKTRSVFEVKRSFTSGIKKIIRKHSDCIYACSETLQVSERRIASNTTYTLKTDTENDKFLSLV